VPRALQAALLLALRARGRDQDRRYERLRRSRAGLPIFWSGAEAFFEVEKRALVAPAVRARLGGLTSWEPLRAHRARFEAAAWDRSDLHWMTYADLLLRLPELLLMRVDKMSMGVSLEARTPFLDQEVVTFALGVPAAMKTRGGQLKRLLKRAVRGVIPDALIDRPKQGFGAPVVEWLEDELGRLTADALGAFVRDAGLLEPAAVAAVVARGGPQPWYLLNLALWWREFIA
jgi:asparagine synthase (glutamine-hydrolysing)